MACFIPNSCFNLFNCILVPGLDIPFLKADTQPSYFQTSATVLNCLPTLLWAGSHYSCEITAEEPSEHYLL